MNYSSTISPAIRSSRFFCSLFFLGAGVGIGAWASSLPVLSAQMELDKAQLGWILIGFALGAIVMMTNIGRLAAIAPSSVLSLLGSLTFGAALLALPYAGGTYWLALIVFFAGIGFGTLDVSMNIDASTVERHMGRQAMSSFHAVFSFGSLIGAFVVGQILSNGGALAVCLGVAGLGVAAVAVVACIGWNNSGRFDDPADSIEATDGKFDNAIRKHLYRLGGLAS